MKSRVSNRIGYCPLWRLTCLASLVIVFLCALMLGGCDLLSRITSAEQPIETFEDAIRQIQKSITSKMDQLKIPGFAMVVIDDQNVVWERYTGWANVENEIPVMQETIFRVASISKVFTALEIMRMRNEGLIDLDVPIEEYLPEFSIQRIFDSEEPVTIRSLLTHRSGLPRSGTLPLWYWDPGTSVLQKLVDSLQDAYAAYPPWTRYKYSNIGYVTLGRVIERIRGGLWPDYMKREILNPIGMTSSAFLSDRLPRASAIATGYFPVQSSNVPGGEYDIIYMPSGNLHSTAGDLAEFIKFIFRDGAISQGQLVESDTLEEMFDPRYSSLSDPQTNGLAWFTDSVYLGEQVVFHSGTTEGTISIVAMLPGRRLGIVVIANSDAFEEIQVQFAFDALDALRQGLYGEQRPANEAQHPDAKVDLGDPSRFIGTYVVNGDRLEIVRDDHGLVAKVQGFALPLTPLSVDSFQASHLFLPGGTVQVTFLAEPDTGIIVTLGGSFAIYSPHYPVTEAMPQDWAVLLAEYEVHPRHQSRYSDADVLWTTRITYDDGILAMPDEGKILLPLDETRILIVGGIYDGEIMTRDPETGTIEWAAFRYVPNSGE